MSGIRTSRQLWGRDFVVGGEWDAGSTPPHIRPEQAGRWTVRLCDDDWHDATDPASAKEVDVAEGGSPTVELSVPAGDLSGAAAPACMAAKAMRLRKIFEWRGMSISPRN